MRYFCVGKEYAACYLFTPGVEPYCIVPTSKKVVLDVMEHHRAHGLGRLV